MGKLTLLPITASVILAGCLSPLIGQKTPGSIWVLRSGKWMEIPQLPDSVILTIDIPYAGTDNRRQMLDLMVPANTANKSLPVIVFIHGGAWKGGHKTEGLGWIFECVDSGQYAGVSIGYRLSSETTWPSQIHDCKAAIRWIRANAKRYGLDSDRIGVWGNSAGGHLVSMLGTSGDVKLMDGTIGLHTNVSSRVTCVVDFYGPTNFLTMNKSAIKSATLDHDRVDSPESRLIGGPIQENPEKVATANPITYISWDDPPFLIVHGTQDPLVSFNQSELLHGVLTSDGITSTLLTVKGGGHGRGFAEEIYTLVSQFFAHYLRDEIIKWEDQTIKAVEHPRK